MLIECHLLVHTAGRTVTFVVSQDGSISTSIEDHEPTHKDVVQPCEIRTLTEFLAARDRSLVLAPEKPNGQ